MNEMIKIEGLSKSWGKVRAVDGVSFAVSRGELFAFLGVNGAGKSTTISVMCGQTKKDAGKVSIGGFDIDREPEGIKRKLGVVFQNSALDMSLSVRDNLESRAALYGIFGDAFKKRLSELTELLDFGDFQKRTVGKLSGGQRRRIDIARALLHRPEILILDEPTTGLDPQTRKLLWGVVSEMRKSFGMTVFLTTHYMEEAAEADRVVILDRGRVAAEGSPIELKNRFSGDYITIYGAERAEIEKLETPFEKTGEAFRLSVADTAEATKLIIAHPEVFRDYEIVKGRMDDVFLAVTGRSLAADDSEHSAKKEGKRR